MWLYIILARDVKNTPQPIAVQNTDICWNKFKILHTVLTARRDLGTVLGVFSTWRRTWSARLPRSNATGTESTWRPGLAAGLSVFVAVVAGPLGQTLNLECPKMNNITLHNRETQINIHNSGKQRCRDETVKTY